MPDGKRSTRGEAERLESLWSGDFGNSYVDRNLHASEGRERFWYPFLERHPVANLLEVGCNIGGNLRWIAQKISPRQVFGIDVNEKALGQLRQQQPGVNAVWSLARDIPFRDRWFELVFTSGVLIHQPEEALGEVMAQVVRCSSRYVLCMEYFAEQTVEVAYHGQAGTLFKRDYGRLYAESFPELRPLEKGFLGQDEGWDDVTWWLFEKGR